MENVKRFRNLSTDSLVAIAQAMRNRLNSAVATGRIDIAQDARIVLNFAIRELKNRGGDKWNF